MNLKAYSHRSISRPNRLVGAEALYAAVIAQAVDDYHGSNEDLKLSACDFFRSSHYKNMITSLGLPSDILPVGVRV